MVKRKRDAFEQIFDRNIKFNQKLSKASERMYKNQGYSSGSRSRRRGPTHIITEDYQSYRRRKNKEFAIVLPIALFCMTYLYTSFIYGENLALISSIIVVAIYIYIFKLISKK